MPIYTDLNDVEHSYDAFSLLLNFPINFNHPPILIKREFMKILLWEDQTNCKSLAHQVVDDLIQQQDEQDAKLETTSLESGEYAGSEPASQSKFLLLLYASIAVQNVPMLRRILGELNEEEMAELGKRSKKDSAAPCTALEWVTKDIDACNWEILAILLQEKNNGFTNDDLVQTLYKIIEGYSNHPAGGKVIPLLLTWFTEGGELLSREKIEAIFDLAISEIKTDRGAFDAIFDFCRTQLSPQAKKEGFEKSIRRGNILAFARLLEDPDIDPNAPDSVSAYPTLFSIITGMYSSPFVIAAVTLLLHNQRVNADHLNQLNAHFSINEKITALGAAILFLRQDQQATNQCIAEFLKRPDISLVVDSKRRSPLALAIKYGCDYAVCALLANEKIQATLTEKEMTRLIAKATRALNRHRDHSRVAQYQESLRALEAYQAEHDLQPQVTSSLLGQFFPRSRTGGQHGAPSGTSSLPQRHD